MDSIITRLKTQDWSSITKQLHQQGYVIVKNILSHEECAQLIKDYPSAAHYRKTIVMERYRFGLGEYKYFKYPLPDIIQSLRENVYEYIVPVANQWMQETNMPKVFPSTHAALIQECRAQQQVHPTPLILRYEKNGFNTLHQDLYGDVYFPMQILFVLNQQQRDFTGGEFVITEQIPRAQSKANVLNPDEGDMVIFTTSFRPVRGSKGFYRVNMKHGVSPLHSGERYSMGIIFHDALS
ncbi:MAG TPA: 2OG-Fe(II) oxygenase [Pseudobacter sp.]|nr:2OG-Fe(II) oxygenase [Pseudobacter sp.]